MWVMRSGAWVMRSGRVGDEVWGMRSGGMVDKSMERQMPGSVRFLVLAVNKLSAMSLRAADVLSGVPLGTVLGPMLFLLYINLQMRLFADDSIVYREIQTSADHLANSTTGQRRGRWILMCQSAMFCQLRPRGSHQLIVTIWTTNRTHRLTTKTTWVLPPTQS